MYTHIQNHGRRARRHQQHTLRRPYTLMSTSHLRTPSVLARKLALIFAVA